MPPHTTTVADQRVLQQPRHLEIAALHQFLPRLLPHAQKDSFRLVSFAMSLLLAFRLNRTYERWKEARASLSGVVRTEKERIIALGQEAPASPHAVSFLSAGHWSHLSLLPSLLPPKGTGFTSLFLPPSLPPPQGTGATSLFLQAATWIKDDPKLVNDFRRFCIVWPYAIKQVPHGTPLTSAPITPYY